MFLEVSLGRKSKERELIVINIIKNMLIMLEKSSSNAAAVHHAQLLMLLGLELRGQWLCSS